ncbi:F-box/kelch-repeat protein At3g06240-like isoform X2 [Euphorbia lathyris]|uniref:F-box/kelch-repeat protein At3g06240-like isoform X2 n=1 Tax=Euphorbia lathyris TaxID=212925 RepID=UPI00331339BB
MLDYLALPDEVVVETILWRLPIKSIMQCRCVCKSWYSLITSPKFISSHLHKTLTKNSQSFLYERDILDKTGSYLLHFYNEDYFRSMLFRLPCNPKCWINIIGSVNGLICFCIYEWSGSLVVNFVLCNPSIGHFLSVPPSFSSLRGWNVKGFGFDERTQDYKILFISSCWYGFIYSLNSNCWSRIVSVPKNWDKQCNTIVFVNGRFHWFACGHDGNIRLNMIMVFDVKGEAFDHIPLPECLATSGLHRFGIREQDRFDIKEFGESSIALIRLTVEAEGFVTHIWMMKEYGLVESWMKLTVRTPRASMMRFREEVIGFINKDEVLIRSATGWITSQKINNNNNKLELEEAKKMLMLLLRLIKSGLKLSSVILSQQKKKSEAE